VGGIDSEEFEKWYKQIKEDFLSDVVFKESVIQMVTNVFSKAISLCEGQRELGNIINFILEETAYTCANFKSVNMVYPTGVSEPVDISIKKYNLSTKLLSYKVSNHAQCHSIRILDRAVVDREVIKFIKERVTNVNFYVVDREGNIIYMNQPLFEIVPEKNAKEVSKITWQNSLKVMKKRDTYF
jgi:hypothetical protein